MPKPNFVISVNCPICPCKLIYVTSTASVPNGELDMHFYRCQHHGGWKLLPSGKIEPYSFTNQRLPTARYPRKHKDRFPG